MSYKSTPKKHKKLEQNNLKVYKAKKVYLARLHTTILNFILRNSSSSQFFKVFQLWGQKKRQKWAIAYNCVWKQEKEIPFKMAKEIILVKEQTWQVCGFLMRTKLLDTKTLFCETITKITFLHFNLGADPFFFSFDFLRGGVFLSQSYEL